MGQIQGWIGTGIKSGWRKLVADITTWALVVITNLHHEIHEGNAYRIFQSLGTDAFDIAAPMTYHVTTPDTTKWAHLVWRAASTTESLLEIFRDDGNAAHFDVSAGDAVVPTNRNHNFPDASGLTVASGVTITQATADVLIYSEYIGSKKSEGADTGGRFEDILKQNTEYLFRLTSVADNNEGSLGLDWYEHTNKT